MQYKIKMHGGEGDYLNEVYGDEWNQLCLKDLEFWKFGWEREVSVCLVFWKSEANVMKNTTIIDMGFSVNWCLSIVRWEHYVCPFEIIGSNENSLIDKRGMNDWHSYT